MNVKYIIFYIVLLNFLVLPAVASPMKIMPIGDSITAYPTSYRTELYNLLTTNGYSIDFVGSRTTSGDTCPDKNHEGVSGKKIAYFTDNPSLDASIINNKPDIIAFIGGTNDIFLNDNVESAPNRLSALIDKLILDAPNAKIYVASIIPMIDNPSTAQNEYQLSLNYGAAIPAIVAQKQQQGKQVYFVDMFNEAHMDLSTDYLDRLHMNSLGAAKMAKVWYEHITNTKITPTPTIKVTPNPTITVTPKPTPCTGTSCNTPKTFFDIIWEWFVGLFT